MTTRLKGVGATIIGGLLVAGIVVAAGKPAPTQVELREPSVVVKTATGVVKSITPPDGVAANAVGIPDGTAGSMVVTVTNFTRGRATGTTDYTFALDTDTQYYLRNREVSTVDKIAVGDSVKVWSLKLVGGTAIKVWDRKVWTAKKTVYIGADFDLTGMTTSLKLTKTSTVSVYAARATSGTVVVHQAATTGGTPVAKTWGDLAKNMRVTAEGTWNDTLKMWSLTRVTILNNQ